MPDGRTDGQSDRRTDLPRHIQRLYYALRSAVKWLEHGLHHDFLLKKVTGGLREMLFSSVLLHIFLFWTPHFGWTRYLNYSLLARVIPCEYVDEPDEPKARVNRLTESE